MNSNASQNLVHENSGVLARTLTMGYSLVCYLIGVVALIYLILFIADLFVPVSVNRGSDLAPEVGGITAIFWNLGVVMVWGMQHTIMARPAFKRVWTRLVPAPAERSTYLVFVAIATAFLVSYWTPMPTVIWDTTGTALNPILTGVFFLGWVIVLFSTFLINHFHLFGLQQAFLYMRRLQSKQETFRTPLLYKLVRHPMMSGVLLALWSIPVLTVGRLVFNLLMTSYVFIGLYFEERTLSAELGEEYKRYQRTTPAVIPGLSPKPLSDRKTDRSGSAEMQQITIDDAGQCNERQY